MKGRIYCFKLPNCIGSVLRLLLGKKAAGKR